MLETDPKSDLSRSFQIGEKDSPVFADVIISQADNGELTSQAYIEAPGKGDEVLILLADKLQGLANRSKKPVKDVATPSNKGARRLYARTEGYRRIEAYDSHKNPIYVRTFYPQPSYKNWNRLK